MSFHVYIYRNVCMNRLLISDITARCVFITGCDTGFGNILAKKLDTLGVKVIAGCLTESGSNALYNESSSRIKTVLLDVTKKDSVEKAFKFVIENIDNRGLWGLVNNAGIFKTYAPSELIPLDDYKAVLNVNFFGVVSVCQTFLPLLRQSHGRLITVCSVSSNTGHAGLSHYASSKAGLKMFSVCLRREFYGSGLSVHIIEPGGFKTTIIDTERECETAKNVIKRSSSEQMQYYGGNMIKTMIKSMKDYGRTLQNSEHVVEAMTHALLAKYPKSRYVVGFDANTFYRMMAWLPDWFGDILVGWPAPYGELLDELI